MLLPEGQAKLLELHKLDNTDIFAEIQRFPNGNVYLQLTDDVNTMTKEQCIQARNFFRPYLPEKGVFGPDWRFAPPSVRIGCLPEELVFHDKGPNPYIITNSAETDQLQ
jgi:hypothetical protein